MKALIVIDIQYDFMPGGTLAVSEGDQVVDPVLKIRDLFDYVVFTQDWHPADHCSFRKNGGVWPEHCVQNSLGAAIDKRLVRQGDIVVQKGFYQDVDSYSGFWDNERKHKTRLDTILKDLKVDTLYVCGLATDYCVKATALDGVDAGYTVYLVIDACRGVDVKEGDSKRAVEELESKGVVVVKHEEIFR